MPLRMISPSNRGASDEKPVGTAQFHSRRNGERSGTCDDENEAGKDRLQLPSPAQRIRRPQYTQSGIVDRLHSPLYARNGERHKAQYPQATLRGIDNQELQGVYHSVRRVLQSKTEAVRLRRHRLEIL